MSQLLLNTRFFCDFPHQIWALRVISLLGSEPLAFESVLLYTFRHFSPPFFTPSTLKVVKVFVDTTYSLFATSQIYPSYIAQISSSFLVWLQRSESDCKGTQWVYIHNFVEPDYHYIHIWENTNQSLHKKPIEQNTQRASLLTCKGRHRQGDKNKLNDGREQNKRRDCK